jgi:hypothetical protein
VEFSSKVYQRVNFVDQRVERNGDADPIDALEHADTEVKAAHIYRICPLPFPGSHFREWLGPTHRTWSSSRRSIDRRVSIIIHKLILQDRLSRRHSGRERKMTDNDFIIIICITELVHDFDNNADEIPLAGR